MPGKSFHSTNAMFSLIRRDLKGARLLFVAALTGNGHQGEGEDDHSGNQLQIRRD